MSCPMQHLCEHCIEKWESINLRILPIGMTWLHCHHDQSGPQPPKEEVKPCQGYERWKLHMLVCPVCGAMPKEGKE